MKRASYREACAWIALNDDAATGDSEETISGYISTLLIADLFAVEPERVARDIARARRREGIAVTRRDAEAVEQARVEQAEWCDECQRDGSVPHDIMCSRGGDPR